MRPIFFSMPGNETVTAQLRKHLEVEAGALQVRRFPDGESYIRFLAEIKGRDIAFVCTLDRPDEKVMALYFAACVARELGARRIGLVAPYLAYMRQDARFQEGEGITSAHFARLISGVFDWMVTVDPHLHRHHELDAIYSIPTKVVHAAPDIATWIAANVSRPVIIGPDSESEQWAAEVAQIVKCPYAVLQKVRHSDWDVKISTPETGQWQGRTPVLVDDIASTARTMIEAVSHIHAAGLVPPVCVAVHPIFVDNACAELNAAGIDKVVSCNTIMHATNQIDLSASIATAVESLLQSPIENGS